MELRRFTETDIIRRAAFVFGFAAALLLSGCVTGRVAIEPGEPDIRLLDELHTKLATTERIPVPAHVRFVSFLSSPLSVPPKAVNLASLAVPRRGEVYQFPVTEAVQSALRTAVEATFEPSDERQRPIQSDHIDVEFRLGKAVIVHYGGPGKCIVEFKVDCRLRLPSDYLVSRFSLTATVAGPLAVPTATGAANPPWQAAAELAEKFHARLQRDDLRRQIVSYKSDEFVCSKVGHKKGLEDEGDFCEIHGANFVPRVALKK